jgi:hypothetical protein
MEKEIKKEGLTIVYLGAPDRLQYWSGGALDRLCM